MIASDLNTDPVRPRLLMSDATLAALDWQALDVTDTAAVDSLVKEKGVTRIIHLAGLQIPFCRANPALGATVNVTGTVNILEAVRNNGVRGLAYASSLAVMGPPDIYDVWPVPDDAPTAPRSLYGVYKVANEDTARIYAADWRVGSVGIRPAFVYGVGRDQGVTADCAKAILAAVAGQPFHIRFDGVIALQHASDVARMFIGCAEAGVQEARICTVRTDVIDVGDFVALLNDMVPGAEITREVGAVLPFPADLDDAVMRNILGEVPHTPVREAIAADMVRYRALLDSGRIDLSQLEA